MIAIMTVLVLAGFPEFIQKPAKSDDEVWSLVKKVGTTAAYQTYLVRFPNGEHKNEAVSGFYNSQGLPVVIAPPAPPAPPAPRVPFGIIQSPPLVKTEPCVELMVNYEMKKENEVEAVAYLKARRANRVSDYQAYILAFPNSGCKAAANAAIKMREARSSRYKPIPKLGPLAAHRSLRLMITEDDYPGAAADRGEQGTVLVEWEVSPDGVAELCVVAESSGHVDLDHASCRLVTARMRYDPARDESGAPERAFDRQSFVWALPAEEQTLTP